jgi:hypothetical protein
MCDNTKIAAKYIIIERAEGFIADCGKPTTCLTWQAANDILRTWATTAPKLGAYDKCDFTVVFCDGKTYSGRYDLHFEPEKNETLSEHCLDFLRFYSGAWCPSHMTKDQYAECLQEAAKHGTDIMSKEYIDNYSFED